VRILIVSATGQEIAPIAARLQSSRSAQMQDRVSGYTYAGHDVDILNTGVGMVATAAWCSRLLTEQKYDFALNLGVCGSFDRALAPGAVVHVVTDRIAELGAEDDDAFLTMAELNLPGDYEFVNDAPPANAALRALPAVRAISVNTVHGNTRTIAQVTARFNPQVESMEGAAFMCACRIGGVSFAQVRAVSNIVEQRNRGAWQMAEAIGSLGRAALDILERA
jgi:futalosine hydrolase